MKVSELIQVLTDLQEEYGDLDCQAVGDISGERSEMEEEFIGLVRDSGEVKAVAFYYTEQW